MRPSKKALLIVVIILVVLVGLFFLGKYVVFKPNPVEENQVIVGEDTSLNEDFICSSNKYNCGDFDTQEQAQETFEYCGGIDNDIHGLDKDSNGLACEGLK